MVVVVVGVFVCVCVCLFLCVCGCLFGCLRGCLGVCCRGCCCCLQLSPRDCCQSCFCLSAVAVGQLLCVNSLAPSSCALSSAFFLSSHPSTSIPAFPPPC